MNIRKKKRYKNNKMTGNTAYLSIITLNVNGIYSPIKRHRLAKWIKKHHPILSCLKETRQQRHIQTKSERMENGMEYNGKIQNE